MQFETCIITEIKNDLNLFYSNDVPRLINDTQNKNFNFLEGALLISNGRRINSTLNWNGMIDLLIENHFPPTISMQDPTSFLSGPTQYLIALELLLGQKSRGIPAYIRIKKNIEDKILEELPFLISQARNQEVETFHYDILYGITSYLNYLLEFYSADDSQYIEDFLLEYLIFICTNKNNTFPFLKVTIENDNTRQINMGISHGINGLYYILSKYNVNRNNSKYTNEVSLAITNIEHFIIKNIIKKKDYYYIPGLVNEGNNLTNDYGVNLSWCYGLAGCSFLYYNNSYLPDSLFFNKNKCIVSNLVVAVRDKLHKKDNIIFESATFCHGLSGLVYELFLVDSNKTSRGPERLRGICIDNDYKSP